MSETAGRPAISAQSVLAPLRSYWHPVEDSAAVGRDPVAATLLEEDLVLFRSAGRVHAFRDVCPHRGTRLSLGWVDARGCLVCPYHGWAYGAEGRCVRIPSQPDDQRRIPARARATAYRAEERYGLVWVALDEPTGNIAPFPEYDDGRYQTYLSLRAGWQASAGRFSENGLDVTHFAWVHPGTLGQRDQAECPDIDIQVTDYGFEYTYTRESLDSPFAAGGQTIRSHTTHNLPFTRRRTLESPAGNSVQYVTARPTRARECEIWMFESRNHHLDDPVEPYIEFSRSLLEQDRRIVESQRPEMLPTDLTEELHVRGPDQVALTYRRAMAQAGIADV